MERRSFLKLVTAAWGALMPSCFAWSDRLDRREKGISFYVAGARYYKVSADLSVSTPVVLHSDSFKGERCYSIHTADGVQLGHVPRKLVPLLNGMRLGHSCLSFVDPYAVPWKRYRVTVLTSEG